MLNSENNASEQIDANALNENDDIERVEEEKDLDVKSHDLTLNDSDSIDILNDGVRDNKFVNLDVSDGRCVVSLDMEQPFDRENLLAEVKNFLKTIEKIENPEARHKARNLLASAFKLNISDLDNEDGSIASDSFFKKFSDYLDGIEKKFYKNSKGEDISIKFSDEAVANSKVTEPNEDTSLLDGFKYALDNNDWISSETEKSEVVLSDDETNNLIEHDEELNE